MDRYENEIDRVLSALGAVEPGAGLDGRILARLEQTNSVALPVLATHRLWWLGGLAFAAACLLAVLVLRPAPRKAEQVAIVSSPQQSMPAVVRSRSGTQAKVQAAHPAPLRIVAEQVSLPRVPEAKQSRGLADLPSMLAPPLPENRQEQLLVQIAHGPGPDEFALLNPEKQELVAQQREAEFDKFFPPQTPQEIYLATHTKN